MKKQSIILLLPLLTLLLGTTNKVIAQENWSACNPDSVFTICTQGPTIINGLDKLKSSLNSDLQGFDQLNGLIKVISIINCNGEIGDCNISESLDPLFDQRLVDLLKRNSKWTPGMIENTPVDSFFSLSFRIEKGKIK